MKDINDVLESKVISVERASQIRKPTEKELNTTPKFANCSKESPSRPVREFDVCVNFSEEAVVQKSFIEALYTNHQER